MEDSFEKHLLVIDDEVEITKSLFRQFRRQYTVHTATSAEDALLIMEQYPIQVVLSDQRMPGMSGVDFFERIRTKYPDALKLILTGYSDIEAVVGAINEGQVFRYLTKPWNPVELDLAIKEAFEKQELISSNKRLLNRLKEVNASLEIKVKERTNELEKVNERLKTLNIEKNKYVGMVAHDLRNPIGNAYNFSELLLSGYSSLQDDKRIKYISVINDRCAYSLKLIEGFLDVSKIESGILDLAFESCDYNQIIEDCVAQNMMFAQKKSQTIKIITLSSKRRLLCDKDKIEQVVNNLLSNAIKYSAEGKTIYVNTECKDNRLFTYVVDEGQGIREDEIDAIFQDYKTTSTRSTSGEKSTGLGLAIVKKIVEAHHGELGVDSIVNEGSTFWFSLPLSD